MYKYIFDKKSNEYVDIHSYLGRQILENYLNSINNKFQTGGNKFNNRLYRRNNRRNNRQNGGTSNISLIYMAKPVYGGWVSFTSHLSLKHNLNLYKIGNKTEKNQRDYGYGVKYRNMSIDEGKNLQTILITAIDKNYYKYLDYFPDGTIIVIHDPTEVKGKSCQPVLDNLSRFKVITIRETVKHFLKEKYNIDSLFLPHPFYEYPISDTKKQEAVSISRIDYDKHTELILKANELLKNKNRNSIKIYGAKNDLYVYRVLRDLNIDSMSDKDPLSNYKGRFSKSFDDINKILSPAKYMVDMSAIKNDGGGSQYTFLEAIYQNCCLILSDKWISGLKTVYKHNYNCIIVRDEKKLAKILIENKDVSNIVKNAKQLLKSHTEINWENKILNL